MAQACVSDMVVTPSIPGPKIDVEKRTFRPAALSAKAKFKNSNWSDFQDNYMEDHEYLPQTPLQRVLAALAVNVQIPEHGFTLVESQTPEGAYAIRTCIKSLLNLIVPAYQNSNYQDFPMHDRAASNLALLATRGPAEARKVSLAVLAGSYRHDEVDKILHDATFDVEKEPEDERYINCKSYFHVYLFQINIKVHHY